MHSFTPGPENMNDFRAALGAFPTGVTVITTHSRVGPLGMTANSFASVSLDPPLVLWAPARASLRFAAFAGAQHFAVHVLGEDQHDICRRFSKAGHEFDGLRVRRNAHGVPLIDGCLTRLECTVEGRHDGGDHLIIIGRVLNVSVQAGDPLVFLRGAYGGFCRGGVC